MGDVDAIQQNLAGSGLEQPGDAIEKCRFPGAVRSDDSVYAAFCDPDIDAVQRLDGAEMLAQTSDLQKAAVHMVTEV